MISRSLASFMFMTSRIVFLLFYLTSLISLETFAGTPDRGPKGLGSVLIFSGTGWYRDGGAIVALHAALVHQEGWPWLQGLAGCDFNSDSEYLKAKVVVDPKARNHPSVKGFGKAFWYTADSTNYDKSVTGLEGLQVLLRIDESTFEPVREYFQTRGGKAMGEDHPIAWIREYDGGRFFYTEFGHDVRSLDTKFGRQHIIEGIRWAAVDH